MKTFALLISLVTLASCSFSGKYSTDSQNFDFTSTLIIPVEECKK